MTLTAAAQWLNTAFAGYDKAILKITHSLAGALGPVLTPLMKLITFLGEKGLLLLVAVARADVLARTRRIGVCVFGAVCLRRADNELHPKGLDSTAAPV